MKKIISLTSTSLILILFLCLSVNTVSSNLVEKTGVGITLYVDDDGTADYIRIQDAINDSSDYDTIFVFNGTYNENIIINKQINLIGEDKRSTIIDAKDKHYALMIEQNNVCVTNFTFLNSTKILYPDPWEYGTISVRFSENTTIKNNIFSNDFIAICLFQSYNCKLQNNLMYGCNIAIWGDNLKNYIHYIDDTNFANEKPIFYYKNCNNLCISGEIGQLFLINCTKCQIENTIITNVTNGFQVCYSNNILINNNSISNIQSTGIHFDHTEFCVIRNNILLDHKALDFIFLDFSCYNTFQNNIVHGDAVGITLMRYSDFNKFYKNDIGSKNSQGMIFDQSNHNEIKFNNINGSFIDRILNKGSGDVLLSRGAFFNKFQQNYWEKWIGNKYNIGRILPKMILGVGSAIVDPHNFPVFIDFDFHPVSEPYVI